MEQHNMYEEGRELHVHEEEYQELHVREEEEGEELHMHEEDDPFSDDENELNAYEWTPTSNLELALAVCHLGEQWKKVSQLVFERISKFYQLYNQDGIYSPPERSFFDAQECKRQYSALLSLHMPTRRSAVSDWHQQLSDTLDRMGVHTNRDSPAAFLSAVLMLAAKAQNRSDIARDWREFEQLKRQIDAILSADDAQLQQLQLVESLRDAHNLSQNGYMTEEDSDSTTDFEITESFAENSVSVVSTCRVAPILLAALQKVRDNKHAYLFENLAKVKNYTEVVSKPVDLPLLHKAIINGDIKGRIAETFSEDVHGFYYVLSIDFRGLQVLRGRDVQGKCDGNEEIF